MLLLGSGGGNVEVGADDLSLRSEDGSAKKVAFNQILNAEIIDGDRIKISFTDLEEDHLKVKTFCQDAVDVQMLQKVHQSIKETLDGSATRPKNLLVFINPGCGHYVGQALYEENVAPIFTLCGISTEVIVTESFGEGRRDLLTRDLAGIDGIIVVGGDGTFADIAQGLLERTQRDAGLELRKRGGVVEESKEAANDKEVEEDDDKDDDEDDKVNSSSSTSAPTSPARPFFNLPTSEFVSNSITIGQIPGGSGNGYVATTSGCHDAASTAILIALGKIIYTDVTAFAELDPSAVMDPAVDPSNVLPSVPSTFRDFSVLMGLVANISLVKLFKMDDDLRKRFGPFRYFLFPFVAESGGEMALRIRYADREDLQPRSRSFCRTDCADCDHFNPSVSSPLPAPTSWPETIVRHKDFVHFVLGPVRYRFSPQFGMFPPFHTADGLLNVLGLSSVSMMKGLLHALGWLPNDSFILDGSPFHLISDELLVECAPEATKPLYTTMEESNFDVNGTLHLKVLRKLLKTYGTGFRDATSLPQKSSKSVSRFLVDKLVKAVVVVGVVGLVGVVVKEKKWKSLLPWVSGSYACITTWITTKTISSK